MTKFTDAAGNEWLSEYNLAGELVKEIDPEGVETVYTYDLRGNLICEKTKELATYYEYDKAGNLTKKKNPDGTETIYTYEANNNLKAEIASGVEISYTYDCLDRVIEIRREGELVKSFGYDKVGNKISETDALGNVTRYTRSRAGDILTATDALGNETRYTYDRCHRLMSIDQGEGRVTTYSRDAVGNITSITDPLGNVETYKYNRRGEVIEKIDRDGNATKIVRNNYGDVARIKYADSTEVEYSYDALRRLKEVRDSLGRTLIERDKLGRETKICDHKGRSVTYDYDVHGNCTSIGYANGNVVNYVYANNRLEGIATRESKTELIYDKYGRLSLRKNALGETACTYNKLGLPDSLIITEAGCVVDSFKYSYNTNGDISHVEQMRQGLPEENGSYDYCYDAIGRLAEVKKNGEILRAYTYDAFGNRLSKTELGMTTKYIYNEANQLISATNGELETKFAYDKRGNITQKTTGNKVSTFRYNAANRLVSATNSDGLSSRYAYNGLGFRVSKTSGNSSIDYILDQTMMYNNLLEEVSNNQSNDYIWHEDTLISKSNIPIYSDRLNTPIRIGDKAYSYDEFGVSLNGEDGMGFIGYMHDDISGTYFAQAREYLPEIGRFAGRDYIKGNVESPCALHEYNYCYSRPLTYVDYDGMSALNNNKNEELFTAVRNIIYSSVSQKMETAFKKTIDASKTAREKAINKSFSREIRVYSNRATNVARPGRAAGAAAKLEKVKGMKASQLSKVNKMAKTKSIAAKAGPSAAFAAVEVGVEYIKDYRKGLSVSKRRSNLLINATSAVISVGLLFVPGVGPLLSSAWSVAMVFYSDDIQDFADSLD